MFSWFVLFLYMVFIWETCYASLSFVESWLIKVWNSISKCLLLLCWPYTILTYCYSSVKSSHIRIKSYYWFWFSSFQSISCVSSSLLSNVIDCWNVSFLYISWVGNFILNVYACRIYDPNWELNFLIAVLLYCSHLLFWNSGLIVEILDRDLNFFRDYCGPGVVRSDHWGMLCRRFKSLLAVPTLIQFRTWLEVICVSGWIGMLLVLLGQSLMGGIIDGLIIFVLVLVRIFVLVLILVLVIVLVLFVFQLLKLFLSL